VSVRGAVLTDEMGELDFSKGGPLATSKLELSFRVKGLVNASAYGLSSSGKAPSSVCVVYVPASDASARVPWNDASWHAVGHTEVQHGLQALNAVFVHKVTLNFFFERTQPVQVRVYDLRSTPDDDLLNPSDKSLVGYAVFTLAELVAAPRKRLTRQLDNALKPNRLNGVLQVLGEEPVNVGCRVAFQIRLSALPESAGSLLGGGKPDPYCVVSKANVLDDAAAPAAAVPAPRASSSLGVPAEEKRRSKSPLGTLSRALQTRRQRGAKDDASAARPYAINRDDWTPVLCTEIVKKSRDVDFARVSLSLQQLCNADDDRELLFEVYDHHTSSKPELIGACRLTFAQLRAGERVHQLVNDDAMVKAQAKRKTYTNSGMLELLNYELTREPSFMEFIVGGCELALIIGVDFTSSNGPATHPLSLHRLHGASLNEYECAITAVGSVLAPYDTDSLVPAYGFGAELDGELSHYFPLRADGKPCAGIAGVLEAYRGALTRTALSGPTVFSEILKASTAAAVADAKAKKQSYTVLLLLTDGVLDEDLEPTLEALVVASAAPISIIIVGVGRADFKDMDLLDSDDRMIVGPRSGRKAVRDAVQFVPYRSFKDDPHLLAREVLYELPRQFLEYTRLAKWQPQPPPTPVDDDLAFQFPTTAATATAAPPLPTMTIQHQPQPAADDEDDAEALLAMFAKPPGHDGDGDADAHPQPPVVVDVPDLPEFSDSE